MVTPGHLSVCSWTALLQLLASKPELTRFCCSYTECCRTVCLSAEWAICPAQARPACPVRAGSLLMYRVGTMWRCREWTPVGLYGFLSPNACALAIGSRSGHQAISPHLLHAHMRMYTQEQDATIGNAFMYVSGAYLFLWAPHTPPPRPGSGDGFCWKGGVVTMHMPVPCRVTKLLVCSYCAFSCACPSSLVQAGVLHSTCYIS